MADEFSIFGQLSGLNPSGQSRDAKEVPVDKDSRRRRKGKGKRPAVTPPETEDAESDPEERRESKKSGKVLDIVV